MFSGVDTSLTSVMPFKQSMKPFIDTNVQWWKDKSAKSQRCWLDRGTKPLDCWAVLQVHFLQWSKVSVTKTAVKFQDRMYIKVLLVIRWAGFVCRFSDLCMFVLVVVPLTQSVVYWRIEDSVIEHHFNLCGGTNRNSGNIPNSLANAPPSNSGWNNLVPTHMARMMSVAKDITLDYFTCKKATLATSYAAVKDSETICLSNDSLTSAEIATHTLTN